MGAVGFAGIDSSATELTFIGRVKPEIQWTHRSPFR